MQARLGSSRNSVDELAAQIMVGRFLEKTELSTPVVAQYPPQDGAQQYHHWRTLNTTEQFEEDCTGCMLCKNGTGKVRSLFEKRK
jgi:hypothetical protein